MAKIKMGTKSIPQGKKGGQVVAKPHKGSAMGSGQWGGSKPSGGRV